MAVRIYNREKQPISSVCASCRLFFLLPPFFQGCRSTPKLICSVSRKITREKVLMNKFGNSFDEKV